jgi:hypothetical protein
MQHDPTTLIHRISPDGAANIRRQPRSACTHPVVSIRLVQNIRQVNCCRHTAGYRFSFRPASARFSVMAVEMKLVCI